MKSALKKSKASWSTLCLVRVPCATALILASIVPLHSHTIAVSHAFLTCLLHVHITVPALFRAQNNECMNAMLAAYVNIAVQLSSKADRCCTAHTRRFVAGLLMQDTSMCTCHVACILQELKQVQHSSPCLRFGSHRFSRPIFRYAPTRASPRGVGQNVRFASLVAYPLSSCFWMCSATVASVPMLCCSISAIRSRSDSLAAG